MRLPGLPRRSLSLESYTHIDDPRLDQSCARAGCGHGPGAHFTIGRPTPNAIVPCLIDGCRCMDFLEKTGRP